MSGKNKIEFFLFKSAQKIFGVLGLIKTRRLALLVGSFFYYFIPIRKKTTIENLSKAFPHKTESEIKQIARNNYQNITITFFELMSLPFISTKEMLNEVEFDNSDLIKKMESDKKGIIFFTGHFGSWEFLMAGIALKINKKFNVLVRPQRNNYITEWLKETRAKFGAGVIDSGVSVKKLFQALSSGEGVGIAGDQRGHYDNPRFNFFNQPTALYTGTASIALRTNSNVILIVPVRQKDFRYKCFSEQLSFDNLPDGEEEKIKELTQRYISFIEKYVSMYPEQYFWMHKIWKY